MKLIIGWKKEIESPTESDLEASINRATGGPNSFIRLELDENRFIQAAGSMINGFSVEWRDPAKGGQFKFAGAAPGYIVYEMFRFYLRGDDTWHIQCRWQKVKERPPKMVTTSFMPVSALKSSITRGSFFWYWFFQGIVYMIMVCPFLILLNSFNIAVLAFIPTMFLFDDSYKLGKNYSLPDTQTAVLAVAAIFVTLAALCFNMFVSLKDWTSIFLAGVIPLVVFLILLYVWVRRLYRIYQLSKTGVAAIPLATIEEGPFNRPRLIYTYTYRGKVVGRAEIPFWAGRDWENLDTAIIRCLPQKPSIHRLERNPNR
jgi:hypothetical protein